MQLTPIIINKNKEDNCPNCGKQEKKIEVCKHCKYIYEEDDTNLTLLDWFIVLVLFVIGMTAVLTIASLLMKFVWIPIYTFIM